MEASLLEGRVTVVTGGAGGIGSAICRRLASAGANVVVGYNTSRDDARAVAGSLAAVPGGHAAMHAPVTDADGLESLSAEVGSKFGKCDLLVNCAGMTRFVPHDDLVALDDDLIDDILRTNVRGPLGTIRALLPLLRRSPHALIVNISSIAAVTAIGSNVIYCASKAALDNMTKSLGRALAPRIRVMSVSPGLVATEFVQQLDFDWRAAQIDKTALGSLATPDQIADAVLAAAAYLTFTTGGVIPVDGGRQLL